MCFYRQLHFNCEHRVQWECLELCITATDSPQPGLCQVRLPVGEIFSEHGFVCKYCSIILTAAVDVGRLPNGDNDEFGGGESYHPPIDPRLVNTGGGRQYHPQIGIDMNQSRDGFWGEGGGGSRKGATSYNMTQGYGNIESRHDELARNQYGYQIIGGVGENLTTNNSPNTPSSQVRPNSQQRYPSTQPEEKSKNRLMSYPYLPPKRISPQGHPITKRYKLALQGPQQESLEHRRTDPSFLQSPEAGPPPNPRYREPPVIFLGDPTTTTRNNIQTTNWSNPIPDDSPQTAKYLKPPNKHEAPYFNYSQNYFDRREASLRSRGVQQLAIIDTLSRVRGSDSPALSLNESKDLYAVTLASETHRYRSDIPHFQARSKVLLKELKNGKDLGDVQFWLRTAEKLKETEGRVAEPFREMEGWMGTISQNAFPLWDGNPRWGWCEWVAGAESHLEGGHGYAGTYVDDNGDVPM